MVCSLLACCQDSFANRLQIMVRKRQSVELIVDEGFYSEQEMKDDLGWTQTSPQITVHFIYSSWTTKIACWIYLGHHIGPGRKSMVPKHGAKRLGKPSAGHSCLHPWKSLNWTLMRTANTREINLYIFRNKSSRSLARFWCYIQAKRLRWHLGILGQDLRAWKEEGWVQLRGKPCEGIWGRGWHLDVNKTAHICLSMQATGEPEMSTVGLPSRDVCQKRAEAEKNHQTKHPKQDKYQQALCDQNSMCSQINIFPIILIRSVALVFFWSFAVASSLYPWQTKDALRTVMASMLTKIGKLRSIIRECSGKYVDEACAKPLCCMKKLVWVTVHGWSCVCMHGRMVIYGWSYISSLLSCGL